MKTYTTIELNEEDIKNAIQMYLATKDILYVSETNVIKITVNSNGEIVVAIDDESLE